MRTRPSPGCGRRPPGRRHSAELITRIIITKKKSGVCRSFFVPLVRQTFPPDVCFPAPFPAPFLDYTTIPRKMCVPAAQFPFFSSAPPAFLFLRQKRGSSPGLHFPVARRQGETAGQMQRLSQSLVPGGCHDDTDTKNRSGSLDPLLLLFGRYQNNPEITPFSSTSIRSAAGTLGRPGMVMMSPV